VIHNHSYEVIPFTVAKGVKLRPILHTSAGIGGNLPVWDIRDKFGDTNLLVTTLAQGHDLAAKLAKNQVVLMRGHGCAVSGISIQDAVSNAIYLRVNAQLLSEAMRFGAEINYLSDGEIAEIHRMSRAQGGTHERAWEYWSRRAGISK
jgi:ribulose-5-phosphate 4-epimerase/fuculose-1-phosphate aldolase